jgi:hypothetical protein
VKIEYADNSDTKTIDGTKVVKFLNELRIFAGKDQIANIAFKDLFKIYDADPKEAMVYINDPICTEDGIPYGAQGKQITIEHAEKLIDHLQSMTFLHRNKVRELEENAKIPPKTLSEHIKAWWQQRSRI